MAGRMARYGFFAALQAACNLERLSGTGTCTRRRGGRILSAAAAAAAAAAARRPGGAGKFWCGRLARGELMRGFPDPRPSGPPVAAQRRPIGVVAYRDD